VDEELAELTHLTAVLRWSVHHISLKWYH
jgi:hypothetical protein